MRKLPFALPSALICLRRLRYENAMPGNKTHRSSYNSVSYCRGSIRRKSFPGYAFFKKDVDFLSDASQAY
jgi:hypothetical protein